MILSTYGEYLIGHGPTYNGPDEPCKSDPFDPSTYDLSTHWLTVLDHWTIQLQL